MPALTTSPFADRTPDNILAEMMAQLPPTGPGGQPLDITPGSFIYDSVSAVAVALAEMYIRMRLLLDYSFVDSSYGPYLDARVAEHGLTRLLALPAAGSITVTGVQGTTIPAGTQFSNVADTLGNVQTYSANLTKQIQPRVGNGTFQETDASIVYTGTWNVTGSTKFSSVTNDQADIYFNGTSITITFTTDTNRGISTVLIDDAGPTDTDTYAAAPGSITQVRSGLSNANHKATVKVKGTKNGASSGFRVDIDNFIISGSTATQIIDTVAVPVQAIIGGAQGNIGSGTVTRLVSSLTGVTLVNNSAAMAGGSDLESDADLKIRFAAFVANPPSSGNIADYKRWAKESTTLVGTADVQPLWNGAGTVKVYIVDTNNNPAAQPILDVVQAYIDPLTGALTLPGAPTVVAGAAGTPNGVYKCQVTFLNTMGETSGGTEATVTVASQQIAWSAIPLGPTGTTARRLYRTAAGGATGSEKLVTTLNDNTTLVFTDNVADSALGNAIPTANTTAQSLGTGKAPIGATVTVVAPTAVTIDIQATLTISTSFDATSVKNAISAAVSTYIKSLPIAGTVRYQDIANAIHDTGGVTDFSALQIRRGAVAFGTANIVLTSGEKGVFNNATYS
jgi:uncharacterized phage protein gp47/JayE